MPRDDLEKRVHEALDDALANDYDIRDWPVEDILIDLQCYWTDMEEIDDPDECKPHIESWLAKARNLQ